MTRTPFMTRCDRAWHENRDEELRLSIFVFRRESEIAGTAATNVYAAFDATADAVKLGIARTPKARVSSLGTGNPNPVELVVAVPAPAGLEKVLHQYLEHDHLRGEWFRCTPRTLLVCELLLSAADFQRDMQAHEGFTDPEMTVEVFASRADELLALVAA